MPHTKKKSRRFVTPLLLFTLAGWALWALGRNEEVTETAEHASTESPDGDRPARARTRTTWSKRRLATSLAFATLFFGGAAFSAGAGDLVAEAIEGGSSTELTSTDEATEEAAPADEEAAAGEESDGAAADDTSADGGEPAAEGDGSEPAAEGEGSGDETPADDGGSAEEGASDEGGSGEPGDGGSGGPGDGGSEPGDGTPPPPLPPAPDEGEDDPGTPTPPGTPSGGDRPGGSTAPKDLPVLDKGTRSPAHLDPEANADGFFATVWLHRPLPDPTPPAKRLKPAFAKALAREAARAKVDWALVLAVLRTRGFDSSSMSLGPVHSTAQRLAQLHARRNPGRALRAYGGVEFAKEARALRNYNHAAGLKSLVQGLEAAKPRLQQMVLRDKRLNIYPGGRLDVALGRTDVRILVLLRYLAEAHGEVTVSSLTTGHRLYARPGVVSAHVYGLAVDVAALDNRPIYGNQEPGGLTQHAVENILALPAELQAKQVISLLGLGGPSFPLANHDDHIHVGY